MATNIILNGTIEKMAILVTEAFLCADSQVILLRTPFPLAQLA